MKTSPAFLQNERKRTDDSLINERSNTNQSLKKARAATEVDIDATVVKDRLEADQATATSRTKADAKDSRSGERLTDERDRSDEAIAVERLQNDATLELERKLKGELAIQLLEKERKLTDKNLSQERTKTDSHVNEGSALLSGEKAEHLKTRDSLTTRDEFLAILSHDLRNPIGAASSCADMLLTDSTFKGVDEETRHWIKFIKRNVDVSLRLISDLLDMERMAVGKLDLNRAPCGLGRIANQSVENLQHVAAAKSIKMRMAAVEGSDVVHCDHDRILQVFSNLIGNALKFTPEGGAVTIKVSLNKNEALVSIQDSGPGIAEHMQAKMFERFAQLGPNDKRGLGLGLYISKMLVEAHSGRIWTKSNVDDGCTFFFTLPLLSAGT